MGTAILKNREYQINNETMPDEGRINHSSPRHFLIKFPSVYRVSHFDTTSTGGDWSGWFLQLIGKRHYLIGFSQEFGNRGATLYTDEVMATFNYMPDSNECDMIMEDYIKYRWG